MTSSPQRPRPATLALILGALTALGPLSIDMYLPSLPTIQHPHRRLRAGGNVRAAGASSLVGVLNDGSARPMAVVMVVCGVAAWIANKAASWGEVSLDRASADE